ncbi:unnamed protein product [Mytilus edulis]|uniref:Uncharacterized protein n=1 Tax=Mytilus edulis TaxID=6550 RepID=A0A8S3SDZ8_MYTED|nr:unnamed protein product [Mytilus edulis]
MATKLPSAQVILTCQLCQKSSPVNIKNRKTEDSHLYSLSKTGLMHIVHDFSPLLPKAVYVSDDNIIMITREKGDVFPPTEQSQRHIVVLDQMGKQKVSVIKYDKQNKCLFSFVMRRIIDKTFDIVCIDALSSGCRRIVKVDNKSTIKWVYEGNADINTDEIPFSPADLAITQSGNIIATEAKTHSLHIISEEGFLIKYFMMEDMNVSLPISLDIDLNGTLWIGCNTYNIPDNNTKFHKLEITGC